MFARDAKTIVLAGLLGAALGLPAAPAGEPLDLVPAESLLVWHARPYPDLGPVSEEPSTLAALLDLGTRLAGKPLDARARIAMRLIETFGAMIHYPHAVALIDARAMAIDGSSDGRRVDQLRMALIVQTGGQNLPFRRIIQKTVNEQTDSGVAKLEHKSAGGAEYQELRDTRLPDWSTIAWGELGGYFVITLGADVWPSIAALAADGSAGLARHAWMEEVRAEHARDALIEIYVAIREIRARLDPFVDGRATDFFAAWQVEQMDRAHWTIGFQDRALYCRSHLRIGERTRTRLWADPQALETNEKLRGVIPEGARFGVYQLAVGEWIPRFISGLVATRSPDQRREIEQVWARIQREVGFDAQAGFLEHLGDHVILHNEPLHPLRLPLAFTTLVEIRGEPAAVRATLDKMSGAWQNWLRQRNDETPVPNPLSIERDPDGIWYMQLGPVALLAWTTTDRYLVESWSPTALRAYLAKAGAAVGKR